MELNMNFLTWNVRGAMSSASSLSVVLEKIDIDLAFITEHKLRPMHKTFFESVHSMYSAFTVCDSSITEHSSV